MLAKITSLMHRIKTTMNKNPIFYNYKEPFIIAEIGGNHEGDVEYAKKLLKLASESGVDAVKFQTYYANKIVSPVSDPNRNAHFKKFELQLEDFEELAKNLKGTKSIFLSSVWDVDSLASIDHLLSIYKIGSGDLTNYPLLKIMAENDKPIIISTAMATLDEVKSTVDFILKINPSLESKRALAILHCVAMYGEPKDEYANLNMFLKIQEEFPNLPVGYSDHTLGIEACKIALSLGASIIEKHFSDDLTRTFRDHHISATKEMFIDLLDFTKKLKIFMGPENQELVPEVETPTRIKEFRRSIYAKKDLAEGTILDSSSTTTLRPCEGIPSENYFSVEGKRLNKSKKSLEPIYYDDLI